MSNYQFPISTTPLQWPSSSNIATPLSTPSLFSMTHHTTVWQNQQVSLGTSSPPHSQSVAHTASIIFSNCMSSALSAPMSQTSSIISSPTPIVQQTKTQSQPPAFTAQAYGTSTYIFGRGNLSPGSTISTALAQRFMNGTSSPITPFTTTQYHDAFRNHQLPIYQETPSGDVSIYLPRGVVATQSLCNAMSVFGNPQNGSITSARPYGIDCERVFTIPRNHVKNFIEQTLGLTARIGQRTVFEELNCLRRGNGLEPIPSQEPSLSSISPSPQPLSQLTPISLQPQQPSIDPFTFRRIPGNFLPTHPASIAASLYTGIPRPQDAPPPPIDRSQVRFTFPNPGAVCMTIAAVPQAFSSMIPSLYRTLACDSYNVTGNSVSLTFLVDQLPQMLRDTLHFSPTDVGDTMATLAHWRSAPVSSVSTPPQPTPSTVSSQPQSSSVLSQPPQQPQPTQALSLSTSIQATSSSGQTVEALRQQANAFIVLLNYRIGLLDYNPAHPREQNPGTAYAPRYPTVVREVNRALQELYQIYRQIIDLSYSNPTQRNNAHALLEQGMARIRQYTLQPDLNVAYNIRRECAYWLSMVVNGDQEDAGRGGWAARGRQNPPFSM